MTAAAQTGAAFSEQYARARETGPTGSATGGSLSECIVLHKIEVHREADREFSALLDAEGAANQKKASDAEYSTWLQLLSCPAEGAAAARKVAYIREVLDRRGEIAGAEYAELMALLASIGSEGGSTSKATEFDADVIRPLIEDATHAAFRVAAAIETAAMALEHIEDQTEGRHVPMCNSVRLSLEGASVTLESVQSYIEEASLAIARKGAANARKGAANAKTGGKKGY